MRLLLAEDEKELSDALVGLLYKWPLFAYGRAEDQDVRVLIVAEKSTVLKQAMNAVFSSCHVLGHQVHVLAAAPQDAAALEAELQAAGLPAAIVGEICKKDENTAEIAVTY